MEFLKRNYFNTTTSISVNSGTETSKYLFYDDLTYQYVSDGFDTDGTAASITISFDSTQSVSRIAMLEHNAKEFRIFYDGLIANTFALTTTAATTTCSFSSNSETAQFFRTTQVNCTSVTLEILSTIEANNEKAVGFFYIGDLIYSVSRIPSSDNYIPALNQKAIVHRLADGGNRIHKISDKLSFSLSWKYLDPTEAAEFLNIYKNYPTSVFVPFGTSTGWDELFAEVIWSNGFDFYRYSDNAQQSGFSGKVVLLQT